MRIEDMIEGLREGKSYTRKSMMNATWSQFPITYSRDKDTLVDKTGASLYRFLTWSNMMADDWMEVETPDAVKSRNGE